MWRFSLWESFSVDGAVKVYPYLAVAALSRSKGTHLRAYQYWTLARGIDVTGRGIVSRAELQEFAKSIGMTRSAIKRAEASLLECDLAMLVNGNYRLAHRYLLPKSPHKCN